MCRNVGSLENRGVWAFRIRRIEIPFRRMEIVETRPPARDPTFRRMKTP